MFQEIDVPEIADFLLFSSNGQCKVIENVRKKEKKKLDYLLSCEYTYINMCDVTIAHFGCLTISL